MKAIFPILLLAVGPSCAEVTPGALAQPVLKNHGALSTAQERTAALELTLDEMEDWIAGKLITDVLSRDGIVVDFATIATPFQAEMVEGKMKIHLSDALPARPRVYAPVVAQAVLRMAPFMIDGKEPMPDCAEDEYMRGATVARVFYELGGEFKPLPLVDGDRVDYIQDIVGAWLPNWKYKQPMLWEMLQAEYRRKQKALEKKDAAAVAKCDARIALIDRAEERYQAFLADERPFREDAVNRER